MLMKFEHQKYKSQKFNTTTKNNKETFKRAFAKAATDLWGLVSMVSNKALKSSSPIPLLLMRRKSANRLLQR